MTRNNGKSKVTISTNSVNINKKSLPKKRPNKKGKPSSAPPTPTGIQTGLARAGAQSYGGMHRNTANAGGQLTEQAQQFIENFIDPLGEHTQSTDAARVPDGALNSSAGAFFRLVETLVTPFQTSGSVDLGGKTFSMLVLRPPALRVMAIIIVKENDGEFDEVTMNLFAITYANLLENEGIYPEYVNVGDPAELVYMTILTTEALEDIVPPSTNGVSGTVDSYRFSSDGINIMFNTPDLIDQGTLTSMRYPLNEGIKVMDIDNALAGASAEYLRSESRVVSVGPTSVSLALNHDGTAAINPIFPSFIGLRSSLPSPAFTPVAPFRNAAGTFAVALGQPLQYVLGTTVPTDVQLLNTVTLQRLTVLSTPGIVVGDMNVDAVRLYQLSPVAGPSGEKFIDGTVTVITLPPVKQSDMLQQNPKTTVVLPKETGGVYMPNSIFQPVFNVTNSGEYRKIVFATKSTNLLEMADPLSGRKDTLDKNFGMTINNFQSIPYACKPLIKVCRSVEIVPSSTSLIGAFTTGCPQPQPEAIDVCKSFADTEPHGFPSDYNSLGKLFGKILAVVTALPRMLQSGRNIANEVTNLAREQYSEEGIPGHVDYPSRPGQKKLRKI